jgi:hypothetical protein
MALATGSLWSVAAVSVPAALASAVFADAVLVSDAFWLHPKSASAPAAASKVTFA